MKGTLISCALSGKRYSNHGGWKTRQDKSGLRQDKARHVRCSLERNSFDRNNFDSFPHARFRVRVTVRVTVTVRVRVRVRLRVRVRVLIDTHVLVTS
jgi:hypothetical protein